MKRVSITGSLLATITAFAGLCVAGGTVPPRSKCDPSLSNGTIFDFQIQNAYKNASLDLESLRGKLTLIVNVATYWGRVTQYHGLNALKSTHGAEGFEVLAVPCNQFYFVRASFSAILTIVQIIVKINCLDSIFRTICLTYGAFICVLVLRDMTVVYKNVHTQSFTKRTL